MQHIWTTRAFSSPIDWIHDFEYTPVWPKIFEYFLRFIPSIWKELSEILWGKAAKIKERK